MIEGLIRFVADKCVHCKHFSVFDDDVLMCDLDSFSCKFEEQIYEPLHMKYCKDCFCFNKGNCIKTEEKVNNFTKPCEHFIYVRKSYPRKSS